ncbi:MAG: tyrosine--tRNA ligase [Chloroflexota bacterium]
MTVDRSSIPGALEILRERGFIQQISDEAGLTRLMQQPSSLYWGVDPTASSLQVGNLLSVMLLTHLKRAGHRPVVLVGGGTGLVGDPSFRTTERPLISIEEIQSNLQGQKVQLSRFMDQTDGQWMMVNNADWLTKLNYIEFLRDIGKHFTVNQLLQHETYRDRVINPILSGATGQYEGLSFIEFNYALLQAYDFLHLYRTEGCRLQVGGSDQWFNILAGVDLIRRVEGKQAFALVTPLITTSSGQKMGKSAAGTIWLDPERTSPYEYYQFWINTEDPDVERFLALFTFLPMEQVRELGRLEGAAINQAKEMLAYEATRLTHGDAAAEEARASSRALFSGDGEAASAPTTHVAQTTLAAGMELVDVLTETGLAQSKRAARDLIKQGGAYVNGERIEQADRRLTTSDITEGQILLRAGRKRYHRLAVQ